MLNSTNVLKSVSNHAHVTEDRQQDVDEEVSIATSFQEDTKRWNEDGEASCLLSSCIQA